MSLENKINYIEPIKSWGGNWDEFSQDQSWRQKYNPNLPDYPPLSSVPDLSDEVQEINPIASTTGLFILQDPDGSVKPVTANSVSDLLQILRNRENGQVLKIANTNQY